MNFSIAEDDIKLISALLDLWKQQDSLSDIEYDLLLDKLKNLYVQVKFGRNATENVSVVRPDTAGVAETVVGAAANTVTGGVGAATNAATEPNHRAEIFQRRDTVRKKVLSLYDEDEIPAVEVKVPVAEAVQPAAEPQQEISEQPAAESKPQYVSPAITACTAAMTEDEVSAPVVEAPATPVVAESTVVSTAPVVAESTVASTAPANPVVAESSATPAPQTPTPQTIGEQNFGGQTIGDMLASRAATIADSVQAAGLGTNQFANVVSLRDAIGFNDKYMFVRELFGGSEDLYAQTIAQLDNFTSIEDALIFICDNFGWTRDNEAASRLFDILDAKLK